MKTAPTPRAAAHFAVKLQIVQKLLQNFRKLFPKFPFSPAINISPYSIRKKPQIPASYVQQMHPQPFQQPHPQTIATSLSRKWFSSP